MEIGWGNHSLWPTMAGFDLQPLFVDSWLAASRHPVAAAQVPRCNYCVCSASRPEVPPATLSHSLCWELCLLCSACLEVGLSLTAQAGWCGRVSVHDSSVSLYGPALRLELPDGDSPLCY